MDTQLLETQKPDEPEAAAATGDDQAISGVDRATSVFLAVRPRLFRIASRVLRNASEAEDVVQEVWVRWQRADRTVVKDPTGFLVTTTTRLAINVAHSAWNRHETPTDNWLVEPADSRVGPETEAETAQAVELAVLLLLEKLTATQRAAYILREAFSYPYGQISETLHLDAANARQLVRRAHLRVVGSRRQPVNGTAQRRLLQAFLAAAQVGDLAYLEEVLVGDMAR